MKLADEVLTTIRVSQLIMIVYNFANNQCVKTSRVFPAAVVERWPDYKVWI